MRPFFSVAISVYNKEVQIQSTLESVLAQTFTDYEIVIVNDGSTDQSAAIIKSFTDPRISYFEQENCGASAGRNNAIAKSNGRYIALLDADDLWHPDYLATLHQLILAYPEQSVFASAVAIENGNTTKRSIYSINNLTENGIYILNYFESSYYNTLLTSSSTIVRAEAFDHIGGYDVNIKSGQDTDLWIRIGINYDIVFINKTLATYRYEKKSLSNQSKKLSHKPKLNQYLGEESKNSALKKFMDLNRFSMAVLSKLDCDQDNYCYYLAGIDLNNLNKKQRFILKQPGAVLKILYKIKHLLRSSGIETSAFR